MMKDIHQSWRAPSAPKPIVIIGAGGIVRDAHMPAYAKAGLTVSGVTDLSAKRAQGLAKDHYIAQVYDDVAAAVADCGTDAIYDIAVPPDAITSILADMPEGAAMLVQKPMGANLEQARAIRQMCRDKKLKAAVNFQLRFSPMIMAARQAIESELIGELLEIEVHLNIFTPGRCFPSSFRWNGSKSLCIRSTTSTRSARWRAIPRGFLPAPCAIRVPRTLPRPAHQ